ncbi:MAG TPA: hypothetical protein VFE82_03480 [Ramlibacter sp.]|jgi:hypothetical protein|uniref:hypothetical protein n=1 Tax=Ramlibacter sp. TaxID=1917967 RepID=UPI002D5AC334|nr:hypothetical protein [Ramlibacter sp.]HZY17513.1 hypothetical protein [Ramlibacter sp.]
MSAVPITGLLPSHLWWLIVVYFLASLAHFSHNAEYIALYPNMPAWLSREDVYLAWTAITSFAIAGGLMLARGWRVAAGVALGAYGASGLAGLAHYTLALCSEHTFLMNLTIWFEAVAGVALAVAAFRHVAVTGLAKKRADV